MVVAFVGSPTQERTSHEQVVDFSGAVQKRTWVEGAVHVHVERGGVHTRAVVLASEGVVIACSFVGTTENASSAAHTARIKHVAVAVTLAFSNA